MIHNRCCNNRVACRKKEAVQIPPRGQNRTGFLLSVRILPGPRGGVGSGLLFGDRPSREVTAAMTASGTDCRSELVQSCESLLRGDKGTSGS